MARHEAKSRRKLRRGFSTGTAAAAAAKAALLALGEGAPRAVEVSLPGGEVLAVAVAEARVLGPEEALAAVIKDAGDDPDVTHKARVEARVRLLPPGGQECIEICGGRGVGVVTRPGLPLAVGQPAINPVPRRMIRRALREAWGGRPGPVRVRVEISVPRGEELARRTLNLRLGIVGGISILGTTGRVIPFSHQAYTATIASALRVARAAGLEEVVLTTGGKSEKHAMRLYPALPELAFVQMADFFAFALKQARRAGMRRVNLVVFFGKALKQARGLAYTHAHRHPQDLGLLAEWLSAAGADAGLCAELAAANTARHALDILRRAGRLELVAEVGTRLLAEVGRRLEGRRREVVILDYDGAVLFRRQEGGEA
jgi:cobalt-precorrin-5B (C1)-methyltransferase